jgi:hypothetical protein
MKPTPIKRQLPVFHLMVAKRFTVGEMEIQGVPNNE